MASDETKPEKKASASSSFFGGEKPFSDISKHILRRFSKDEYSQLKQDLRRYGWTNEELVSFFSKEGHVLLMRSLNSVDNGSLNFLIEMIPKEALQEVLKQDDFAALRSFLRGQVGLEKTGLYDSDHEKNQIAKFKTLLSIDTDAVKNFMAKGSTGKSPLSDTVKANFKNALEQFGEKGTSINEPKIF